MSEALEEAGCWLEETGTTFAFVLVMVGTVGWIGAGLFFVLGAW